MNAAETTYFKELALDIAKHGGFGERPLVELVQEAHERRMKFAQEMLEGRSERAKMAHKVLAATVYGESVAQAAAETAIEHCGHIADYNWRRSVGMR